MFMGCAVAKDQRVLFVGNSFSFVSGGVWAQYKTITEACLPGMRVTMTFEGAGGRTLHESAMDPATRTAVMSGQYDLLVLQDQSEMVEDATADVREFYAPQAIKHGASIGFYETWATPGADGKNLTGGTMMRKSYYESLKVAAVSSGATAFIARAGEAFLEVLKDQGYDWELPGFLNLLAEDMDHPTALGLNLVAWVMTMRFNNPSFTSDGCDASRVPNAHGQSDDMKARFARIACELAYICPRAPRPPPPKLCDVVAAMQGEWVSKSKVAPYECNSLQLSGTPWLRPDCTYTDTWVVNGTEITQTSKGETKQHFLRMAQYGRMCIVKLIPAFAYVAALYEDKVQFNDCSVWTRRKYASTAVLDECWCSKTDSWRDASGDACGAYAEGQRKGDGTYCESEGSEHISKFNLLTASQACPACGRCTMPPPDDASERRLTWAAVPGSEVTLI